MEAFEGVFTKRGEAEADTCTTPGVFTDVFVRRGRWRKGSASTAQKSPEDVIDLAESVISDNPTVEYPLLLADIPGSPCAGLDLSRFVVKNTFVNAPIIDLDSLQDFLEERKVKSCPASRQVSSVTMLLEDISSLEENGIDPESCFKEDVLKTASSYGFIDIPVLCDAMNIPADISVSHVKSEYTSHPFNTASTFMDVHFDRCLADLSDLADNPISEGAPPLPIGGHLEESMFNSAPIWVQDEIYEEDATGDTMLIADRLKSLRMMGSAIQQKIDLVTPSEFQHEDQLLSDIGEAHSVAQQTSNQFLVAVQTPEGIVPGMVTLLGGSQQQMQFPKSHVSEHTAMHAKIETAVPSPPPPFEAPVLRLAEAIAPPEVGGPELPSIGSLLHYKGECKPCTFFHTRGCENEKDCQFCHLCKRGEKKKRLKAMKAAQREANFAALEKAKAVLASFRAAEDQDFEDDTIVE